MVIPGVVGPPDPKWPNFMATLNWGLILTTSPGMIPQVRLSSGDPLVNVAR